MTTNMKIVWNTRRYYTTEGQVIFAELGWYPDRPSLVAMYDRCRGICYVYDFAGMPFEPSTYELRDWIMDKYDNNRDEATPDYDDPEYFPALNAWRNSVVEVPKTDWPDIGSYDVLDW